jgi:hypothetical protein
MRHGCELSMGFDVSMRQNVGLGSENMGELVT